MPAQHGRRVDQVDAAHRGIETGIEEAARALDQRLQWIGDGLGHVVDGAGDLARDLLDDGLEQARLSLK